MEDLRIEPRRATAQELQGILVAVRCGVASPQVTTLLGHIAALVQERDTLQRQLDIANDRKQCKVSLTDSVEHVVIGMQPEGPCEWVAIYKVGHVALMHYDGGKTELANGDGTNAEVLDRLTRKGFHVVGDMQDELMSVRACRLLSAQAGGRLYREHSEDSTP